MRITTLIILTALCNLYCHAQHNNIWYFGDRAGINFNPNTVTPPPTVLSNSAMNTHEGSSSVCDINGNLLFYSNGIGIFNRDHQIMLNGDALLGHHSAVQSCVIIPQPGNDSIFYVFTVDAVENNFQNGYRYSVVNMRRDNNKGEVVIKNTMLWPSCSERITAARHANGIDVWIITNDNNSNTFRAWLLTCTGLETATPVVSASGVVMDQHVFMNIGHMKVSPDGTQLVHTHFPEFDAIGNPPNFFQLFDFNNNTGVISNARSIASGTARYIFAEFSPDSRLLYVTRPNVDLIEQFEPKLPSAAAIVASGVTIPSAAGNAGLQLAPDGKIYVNSSMFLDVINRPNVKGAGCDYRVDQVSLGRSGGLSMPSFLNDVSVDPYNDFTFQVLDSCSGSVQFNGTTNMTGVISWEWDFGDGNTSTLQNPFHQFTPSNDLYIVKLKITSTVTCNRSFEKVKLIRPSGVVSKVNFSMTIRCDSNYVRFTNLSPALQNSIDGQFTWDFGDGDFSNDVHPIHTFPGPGVYDVKLKFTTTPSCLDDSLTRQLDLETFTVTMSPGKTILPGQSAQISASAPGATSYAWTPAASLSNPNIATPLASPIEDTWYKVTVTNGPGCRSEDSVLIQVLPLDDFYVPSAFTPNNDGRNDDIKPVFGAHFTLREFTIFSRSGQRLFTTNRRGHGWNGKLNSVEQNAGVYVWMIRAEDKGKTVVRKGTLVLIR